MAKPTNYKGIHITVTYAMGYDYYEIRQINKGKKWNEKILFSTLKEAKMYIDEHYDELIKNESKKSARKSDYILQIDEFLSLMKKEDITVRIAKNGYVFFADDETLGNYLLGFINNRVNQELHIKVPVFTVVPLDEFENTKELVDFIVGEASKRKFESKKSIKEKMDSKSEEIYDLLYRLFQLDLIQTNDYDEDRFDEITDYIEKNGVDKSYKNEAYKLAMRYINNDFSNDKEYKEIVKKFLDLFGLQVNTHSVEWNIISENKKSARKSIRESYDYDDIKDKTPIIDVWGNSEGTHVYEVFKINSDYVYYEYNYRKHDSTMIVDNNEIEVIIRLMGYLPTKFIVKQEDKIGMLESAIANIKAIDKHYGKLKKYNSNYYWQAVRFIKNSMLKDDDPDASNYFDEADDVINDALEQNGDSFRV